MSICRRSADAPRPDAEVGWDGATGGGRACNQRVVPFVCGAEAQEVPNMRNLARFVAMILLPAALLPAGAAATAAAAPRPAGRLKPCHVEGVQQEVLCGTYPVWEDRTARRGRKIDLNVVALPALSADRAPDALVVLAGGRGGAATGDAAGLADDKELRKRRDILAVDQRGTGRSNPLDCDFYGPDSHAKGADPKLLAGDLFPPEAVRRCRDRLAKVADLRLYTTALGMDDVDEVRAWLGYDKVDLFGGAYPTPAPPAFPRPHPPR